MKKILLLAVVPMMALAGYAQDYKKIFETYTEEKRYVIDGSSIVVSKIIEDIPAGKKEIYGMAKAYIARAYGSAKDVIQMDDPENGTLIIKGIFTDVLTFGMGTMETIAHHTLRIDVKEGKARVIFSVSEATPRAALNKNNTYGYVIVNKIPFTNKGTAGVTRKALEAIPVKIIDRMSGSIDALEKVLRGGGVLESEKEDW